MKSKRSSQECTNPWFTLLAIFLVSFLTISGIFAIKGHHKFRQFGISENIKNDSENVLIASTGKDLKFPISAQFETCKYFIIVNPSSGKYSNISNTANFYNKDRIGNFIVDNNITTVITGTMNINTYQILKSLHIDIYTGVTGTGVQVIKLYQEDKLVEFSDSGSSMKEKRISPIQNNLNFSKKIIF